MTHCFHKRYCAYDNDGSCHLQMTRWFFIINPEGRNMDSPSYWIQPKTRARKTGSRLITTKAFYTTHDRHRRMDRW